MHGTAKSKTEQRKNWVWAVAAIALFISEFIACRYVFFDSHGMKDFPVMMAVFGGIILLLSLVFRKRSIIVAAALGYIASFALGFWLHGYSADPGGGQTSSFWQIWMFAYIGFLALGAFVEILRVQWKIKA